MTKREREREKKKSGLVTNRNTNEKNFLSRSVYLVLYNGERERENDKHSFVP